MNEVALEPSLDYLGFKSSPTDIFHLQAFAYAFVLHSLAPQQLPDYIIYSTLAFTFAFCLSMRLKTLNGAPLSEQLDFSEHSLVEIEKCSGFSSISRVPQSKALKWRRITSEGTRLHTGWSQTYFPGNYVHHDASSTSLSIPFAEKSLADLAQENATASTFDAQSSLVDDYLEQSLIFHDTLLSSQVLADEENNASYSSSSFLTTSFETSFLSLGGPDEVDGPTLFLQMPSTVAITPLGSLPNAQQLRSIYPKTLTPNFLCVLMAGPERRQVFVQKGGHRMDLWELIVADDTRSDFKVSIWLRPSREPTKAESKPQNVLFQTLESLQVGDILFLRNIVLTSFRQNVYGQSLKSTIARARTTIDVLMRSNGVMVQRIDALSETFTETFKRVQRWARAHVALDGVGARKRKASSVNDDRNPNRSLVLPEKDDYLPPDTMESI